MVARVDRHLGVVARCTPRCQLLDPGRISALQPGQPHRSSATRQKYYSRGRHGQVTASSSRAQTRGERRRKTNRRRTGAAKTNESDGAARMRWLFFWGWALYATQGRFTSLMLSEVFRFDAAQIGMIFALPTLLNMVAPVVWGYLADRVLGWRVTLTLCTVVAAAVYSALPFASSFGQVLAIKTVHSTVLYGILPVMDGACMAYLERTAAPGTSSAERRAMYGSERWLGTVSWGATHFLLGLLFRRFSYLVMVPASLLISAVFVVYIWGDCVFTHTASKPYAIVGSETRPSTALPDSHPLATPGGLPAEEGLELVAIEDSGETPLEAAGEIDDLEDVADEGPTSLASFLWSLVLDPLNVAVLVTFATINIGTTLVENLVFLFFTRDLGASNLLLGTSVVVTVSFELPLFFVAPRLLKSIGSTALMVIGLLSYAVRVTGYTMIPPTHQWLVLALEPLHGVTYSTIQLSMVHYISSIAPAEYPIAAQASLTACRALGGAVGVMGGSLAMDAWGSTVTYRLASVMVFAVTGLYATAFAVFSKPRGL